MESFKPENQINKSQTYELSLAIAKDLWKKYETEIQTATIENPDSEVSQVNENEAIRHFLRKVPKDVQKRFSAHGITKGYLVEQLAALINICANKAMKGMYGPLGGEAQFAAYDNGSALVLSKAEKDLGIKDAEGELVWDKVAGGVKIDIGAIVLNSSFYPLYDELKKRFPDVNILKANELPDYLTKE